MPTTVAGFFETLRAYIANEEPRKPAMLKTEYKFDPKVAAIHTARVNVKSLAAEAKIIRKEERRCGSVYRNLLSHHRRTRLREEARYAHLALAYLRGRAYRTIEAQKGNSPDAKRLAEKIKRHWWQCKESDVLAWIKVK
jgi:hypothetical protein